MNWQERIDEAKRIGFDDGDFSMASFWDSCAVGEAMGLTEMMTSDALTEIYKHTERELLLELGHDFATAVENNNVPQAEKLYEEIHALLMEIPA